MCIYYRADQRTINHPRTSRAHVNISCMNKLCPAISEHSTLCGRGRLVLPIGTWYFILIPLFYLLTLSCDSFLFYS